MRMGHPPLFGYCGVVTNNFSLKAGCPSSVCSFDDTSQLLPLSGIDRRRYFCKTQVCYKYAYSTSYEAAVLMVEPLRE